jgi:galactitol-specific phosphotransferase system IIB component
VYGGRKQMSKLIVVACGAGINTSTIAEDSIRERIAKEGFADVEVKRILMADIEGYLSRTDLIMVVSMMKIFRTFDVPVFQGMPFLIGSQQEKDVLLDKIVEAIKKA